jgi:alpha-mannosidase
MPLKQANERCQTLLAAELEPLAAYGRFVQGDEHETALIRHCWKRLLENHPHDSICGCSTDQVHRDMAPRFDECRLTAERLLANHLEGWTPNFAPEAEDDRDTTLCVANPLPEPRREVVTRRVALQPLGYDLAALRLFDEAGREVPCALLDAQYLERFWGIDYRMLTTWEEQVARWSDYRERFAARILKEGPGRGEDGAELHDCHLTIQFEAELPACGHAVFFLREAPGAAAVPAGEVRAGDGVLENGLVRVELEPDGTLGFEDLRSGVRYAGLCALEDAADVGDEYDFAPAPAPAPARPRILPGAVRTVRNSGLEGVLTADFVVRLPAAIGPDRTRRDERTVDCPARIELRLRHGSPRLDVRLEFENNADDHRLRVLFPTPHAVDTLISEGHYLVHERPLVREPRPDWTQPPPATWPQQGFSCLEDGAGGLAVLNRGLPEVEGFRTETGAGLALTLLRCVDWLSRDDLSTRPGNAGPTLRTPEAQCRGAHVFEFALLPYRGDWLAADVAGESRRWRCAPRTLQGVVAGHRSGGSLLRSSTTRTAVTAVKRCEERDTLIVRVCNLASVEVEERLVAGFAVREAHRTNLLEERRRALPVSDNALVVSLRPHEIATLELVPG